MFPKISIALGLASLLALVKADWGVYGQSCATGLTPTYGDGFDGGSAVRPGVDSWCDAAVCDSPLSMDDDSVFAGENPCNRDETFTYTKDESGVWQVTVDGGDGSSVGSCVYGDKHYEACEAAAYACLLIEEAWCTSSYCI